MIHKNWLSKKVETAGTVPAKVSHFFFHEFPNLTFLLISPKSLSILLHPTVLKYNLLSPNELPLLHIQIHQTQKKT